MGKKKSVSYKKLKAFPTGVNCDFCNTSKNEPALLGDIYQICSVSLHYLCLLSASEVKQLGTDDEGLLGFFTRDIKHETNRGAKITCKYCEKKGATIKCSEPGCRLTFHLPCGLNNGSLHQYFDSFKSFCKKHKPTQKIPAPIIKNKSDCPICFTEVSASEEPHIWPPCCKPKVLLHKQCCQKYASNSGYLLKCPLCNNKETFGKGIRKFGIFVPDQEATWEVDANRREQDANTVVCTASFTKECRCTRGSKFSSHNSPIWQIEVCVDCGSGMHRGCMPHKFNENQEYKCDSCASVRKDAQAQGQDQEESEDEVQVPTCNRRRLEPTKPTKGSTNNCSTSETNSCSDQASERSRRLERRQQRTNRRQITPPANTESEPNLQPNSDEEFSNSRNIELTIPDMRVLQTRFWEGVNEDRPLIVEDVPSSASQDTPSTSKERVPPLHIGEPRIIDVIALSSDEEDSAPSRVNLSPRSGNLTPRSNNPVASSRNPAPRCRNSVPRCCHLVRRKGNPGPSCENPATSCGNPATSCGNPASCGNSAMSSGNPATSSGNPETSSGVPATSNGDPATRCGVQVTSCGVPATSNGNPATSSGVQVTSCGVPATSSGNPATTSGVQATITRVPATSSENPTSQEVLVISSDDSDHENSTPQMAQRRRSHPHPRCPSHHRLSHSVPLKKICHPHPRCPHKQHLIHRHTISSMVPPETQRRPTEPEGTKPVLKLMVENVCTIANEQFLHLESEVVLGSGADDSIVISDEESNLAGPCDISSAINVVGVLNDEKDSTNRKRKKNKKYNCHIKKKKINENPHMNNDSVDTHINEIENNGSSNNGVLPVSNLRVLGNFEVKKSFAQEECSSDKLKRSIEKLNSLKAISTEIWVTDEDGASNRRQVMNGAEIQNATLPLMQEVTRHERRSCPPISGLPIYEVSSSKLLKKSNVQSTIPVDCTIPIDNNSLSDHIPSANADCFQETIVDRESERTLVLSENEIPIYVNLDGSRKLSRNIVPCKEMEDFHDDVSITKKHIQETSQISYSLNCEPASDILETQEQNSVSLQLKRTITSTLTNVKYLHNICSTSNSGEIQILVCPSNLDTSPILKDKPNSSLSCKRVIINETTMKMDSLEISHNCESTDFKTAGNKKSEVDTVSKDVNILSHDVSSDVCSILSVDKIPIDMVENNLQELSSNIPILPSKEVQKIKTNRLQILHNSESTNFEPPSNVLLENDILYGSNNITILSHDVPSVFVDCLQRTICDRTSKGISIELKDEITKIVDNPQELAGDIPTLPSNGVQSNERLMKKNIIPNNCDSTNYESPSNVLENASMDTTNNTNILSYDISSGSADFFQETFCDGTSNGISTELKDEIPIDMIVDNPQEFASDIPTLPSNGVQSNERLMKKNIIPNNCDSTNCESPSNVLENASMDTTNNTNILPYDISSGSADCFRETFCDGTSNGISTELKDEIPIDMIADNPQELASDIPTLPSKGVQSNERLMKKNIIPNNCDSTNCESPSNVLENASMDTTNNTNILPYDISSGSADCFRETFCDGTSNGISTELKDEIPIDMIADNPQELASDIPTLPSKGVQSNERLMKKNIIPNNCDSTNCESPSNVLENASMDTTNNTNILPYDISSGSADCFRETFCDGTSNGISTELKDEIPIDMIADNPQELASDIPTLPSKGVQSNERLMKKNIIPNNCDSINCESPSNVLENASMDTTNNTNILPYDISSGFADCFQETFCDGTSNGISTELKEEIPIDMIVDNPQSVSRNIVSYKKVDTFQDQDIDVQMEKTQIQMTSRIYHSSKCDLVGDTLELISIPHHVRSVESPIPSYDVKATSPLEQDSSSPKLKPTINTNLMEIKKSQSSCGTFDNEEMPMDDRNAVLVCPSEFDLSPRHDAHLDELVFQNEELQWYKLCEDHCQTCLNSRSFLTSLRSSEEIKVRSEVHSLDENDASDYAYDGPS